MKLTNSEIDLVLQCFPLLRSELSYEIITHKKVYNPDVILAIPEGKKCFVWITNYQSDSVCFLLELNNEDKIADVNIITTGFDDSLATGTVFYGTLFLNNYFCIEDMYYYKNKNYVNVSYLTKLETISYIFKNEISQIALNNKFIIFGLPLMNKDFNNLLKDIQNLPYKISHLKHRFFDKNNTRKIMTMNYFKPKTQCLASINPTNNTSIHNTSINSNSKNTLTKAVFKVTADIEPDIYNLFVFKNGQEEYYDVAIIPDYNTSVMMNKLFRKIKENENLDSIEESDNEDEFEDGKEDRYVYLDRTIKLNCVYNTKFKKWYPVSLADQNDKIMSINSLKKYC